MDFAEPLRRARMGLVSGRGHYDRVLQAVRSARRSVWIATANLKELMVETEWMLPGRRRGRHSAYRSAIEIFDELAACGVELRVLHAKHPSRAFRDRFDGLERLVRGGMELRMCPRMHMKMVLVDASLLYLGSANWTGAGLGVKNEDRRNFELGILTDDEATIDAAQDLFDRVWRGEPCGTCKLRDGCEMPLDRVETAS